MKSIKINISNDKLANKVIRMLKSFKDKGFEMVSKEDKNDLRLLRSTRDEESISFDDI